MCLAIEKYFRTREEAREFSRNPLIAKRNKTVWKVFKCDMFSPFKCFKYERGFVYYQTGNRPFGISIHQSWSNEWMIHINRGLHSYSTLKRASNNNNMWESIVIECIIPKGSKYFLNKRDEEYVSDQLLIPEE